MSERLRIPLFTIPPLNGPTPGLSCGDVDRSRLAINAARFRAALVQLRPALRRPPAPVRRRGV